MALNSNRYTEQYLEQNILFAKTAVIKLAEAAELMNMKIVQQYGQGAVDPYDLRTWKYYLNISGEYHFTDTPMEVVSIDTLEPIIFSKQNLMTHTATAAAYQYGTRNYYTLLSRFPEQALLINGILTPADLDKAIEAESGSIVSYRKDLIEVNEVTLVQELELHLKRQIARWYNVQFVMSDNLYGAVFMTVLWLFLLPRLLNLRLARCKTAEAHSYHVRMYLASHGHLDTFLPYLTLKQSLWLYRNIAYLERNVGQQKQFRALIQKLLTERGIPVGEYSVRHLDEFETYLPTHVARVKPLNDQTGTQASQYETVERLLEREKDEAPDNEEYLETWTPQILNDFQTADSGVIQTKVLNSTMVDYTDAVPETFEMVAIRQWCYMSQKGFYDVTVSFKDPKTSEDHTVFAKDAFAYFWYVTLYSNGYTFDTFPEYLNLHQRRHPKPTLSDLMSVVDHRYPRMEVVARSLLQKQPSLGPLLSVSAFNQHAHQLTDEAYRHWFIISQENGPYERGMVENMVHRLYENEVIELDIGGLTIPEWLNQTGLPVFNYDKGESEELIKSIFEAATGRIIDQTKVLKNIQKAMIDLMMTLSSYSLQFVREITDQEMVLINWPAIRTGEIKFGQDIYRYTPTGILTLESVEWGSTTVHHGSTLESYPRPQICHQCSQQAVEIDPATTTTISIRINEEYRIVGPAIHCTIEYDGQDFDLEQDMMLPGYTTFDQLTLDQQRFLKSKY